MNPVTLCNPGQAVHARSPPTGSPRMGAEDVVVADHGLVYTGTEDGTIFRGRPDGSRVDASATPADGRSASSSLPTAGCSSRRPRRACSPWSIATGAVERLVDRSTAAGWSSATTPLWPRR